MSDQSLRVGVAILTLTAVVLFALDVSGAPRTAALVAFVLFGPGLAWARTLKLEDLTDTVGIGIAIGLAVAAMVGQTMALAAWWSPGTGLAVLVALTAAGLAIPVAPHTDGDARR